MHSTECNFEFLRIHKESPINKHAVDWVPYSNTLWLALPPLGPSNCCRTNYTQSAPSGFISALLSSFALTLDNAHHDIVTTRCSNTQSRTEPRLQNNGQEATRNPPSAQDKFIPRRLFPLLCINRVIYVQQKVIYLRTYSSTHDATPCHHRRQNITTSRSRSRRGGGGGQRGETLLSPLPSSSSPASKQER